MGVPAGKDGRDAGDDGGAEVLARSAGQTPRPCRPRAPLSSLTPPQGWLLLPGAIGGAELEEARSAAYELREAGRPFEYTSDPRLGRLAFNRAAWPVVMELTRGQPMIRLGGGIHNAPGSGGGGMLHSNREGQRSSTVGSPSMARYEVRDGRIFCQDFLIFCCTFPPIHPRARLFTTRRPLPRPGHGGAWRRRSLPRELQPQSQLRAAADPVRHLRDRQPPIARRVAATRLCRNPARGARREPRTAAHRQPHATGW